MDALQTYAALVASPAYLHASRRVMRQLLEALLFERVVVAQWPAPDHLCIAAADGRSSYQCQARQDHGFGRIRVLGAIERVCGAQRQEALDPAQFLAEIGPLAGIEPAAVQRFASELLATQVKHAQGLQARGGELLQHADYDTIEARLVQGHPYHPGFKSRQGFDLVDNSRFAPELAGLLSPWLLAAHRDHCRWSASTTLDPARLWRDLLGPSDAQRFQATLEQRGLRADHYLPLPVHPWQWREVIAVHYHPAFARGELVPIGAMASRYHPQQSIRTLANADDPLDWTLKLSLSLVNTSASRVLAPHTVANAAPISDWLTGLVDRTCWDAPLAAPVLLRERAGISYVPRFAVAGQYGALGCIWRESVPLRTPGGTRPLPMSALCHIDGDGQPLIAPWLRRYGAQAWLRRLLECAFLPVLQLLWTRGVALESHAQNMVLLHAGGWPKGVMLKDFHDGVRYGRDWLDAAPPVLLPTPAEHAQVNPNSFLECDRPEDLRDFTFDALCFVNLAELAWSWTHDHGLDEAEFWALARTVITEHQAGHPALAAAFARFDVLAPTVGIEPLASRRLRPDQALASAPIANPLAPVPPCD